MPWKGKKTILRIQRFTNALLLCRAKVLTIGVRVRVRVRIRVRVRVRVRVRARVSKPGRWCLR